MSSSFRSITLQGHLLNTEVVQRIQADNARFQKPSDFGLDDGTSLTNEIQFAYSNARRQWEVFRAHMQRIGKEEAGTTQTRRYWILPLLNTLGYAPEPATKEEVNGQTYAISHRDSDLDGFPIHIMGFNDKLERRRSTGGGPRLSPHGLVQEYLNQTDHLYGLVTNGLRLRLLRNSTRFSVLSFVEFDLQAMMEDELYADFALMYRLVHASRMPRTQNEAAEAILEHYHQQAVDAGARIRDRLRGKVEETIRILGNGFLRHPENHELRRLVANEELDSTRYYGVLLKLIYRLLFLLVIEERKLIFARPEKGSPLWLDGDEFKRRREIYQSYYSISRLRELAGRRHITEQDAEDLWEGLQATFRIFESEDIGRRMGIQALGGELFSPKALEDVSLCRLTNRTLLEALEKLGWMENEDGDYVRVNYGDLDVEEFGAVYESLLDYQPRIRQSEPASFTDWQFYFAPGSERKSTGSYYTRPELVQELLRSALEPVMEDRLKQAQTREGKKRALLSLKICDPAAGSGHFLLAAARKVAARLATIETGEDEPTPQAYRQALREVVQHCIYGVDLNPMAVELCQVALWLESYAAGYPLTFLRHHIRVGNSLVGLDKTERLNNGIPDEAFKEVTGGEKQVAQDLRKRNKKARERGLQVSLAFNGEHQGEQALKGFSEKLAEIDRMPDSTLEERRRKEKAYDDFTKSQSYRKAEEAANIWTAAFFTPLTEQNLQQQAIPVTDHLYSYLAGQGAPERLKASALQSSVDNHFFHWPLEFPQVYEKGGFDVVLGNPPWERIKLQEKEFFATRDETVSNAPNAAERKKKINKLKEDNPGLYREFLEERYKAESVSRFARASARFDLTAKGDINTYQIFSELGRNLINPKGHCGIIVPTGIATDDTCKFFFADLVENQAVLSLYDFENREKLFADVDSRYKFCLLTMGGEIYRSKEHHEARFAYFLTHPNQLDEEIRLFTLTPEDLMRINPNTKTSPIFRTRPDAEITRKIYRNVPVLLREIYDEQGKKVDEENPWGVSFMRMFDMSNDSDLFKNEPDPNSLPLYEAKMIWQYDHRFGTYETDHNGEPVIRDVTVEEKQDPDFQVTPRYWVDERHVWEKATKLPDDIVAAWRESDAGETLQALGYWLAACMFKHNTAVEELRERFEPTRFKNVFPSDKKAWNEATGMAKELLMDREECEQLLNRFHKDKHQEPVLDVAEELVREKSPEWLMGFRDITNATNERTSIFSIFNCTAVGNNMPLMLTDKYQNGYLLLSNVCSIILDFVARHKAGGTHMNFFIVEQFPVLSPDSYSETDKEFIRNRVLELTYTSHELKPFAESLGYHGEPFTWDEERRHLLKAELDAYYARLYGLTREELEYILDPQTVYGEDFPGETFRVLKKNEVKAFGEYRTQRLVLEAWERLEDGRPMVSEVKDKEAAKSEEGSNLTAVTLTEKEAKPKQVKREAPAPFKRAVLAAYIIDKLHDNRYFGSVKLQKLLYLAECYISIAEIQGHYYRQAAGPYDNRMMRSVHSQIQRQGWFEIGKDGDRTSYVPTEKTGDYRRYFERYYSDYRQDIDWLIEQLKDLDTQRAEIVATAFAAWNDFLIDGNSPSDDEIVHEVLNSWAEEKKDITTDRWYGVLKWMRDIGLVPSGVGEKTIKSQN